MGVLFDTNLSWDNHVGAVSRRCNGMLIGLSQARHMLPHQTISMLVSALVLSQVRYCASVYGNGTKKNMDRIQKILNFGAKVIFGRKKFDHVSDLREKLGWLPAQLMADHSTLCLTHKVLEAKEPESLAAVLRYNRDSRQRTTRQDDLLYVPRSRTEAGKRRFCSRAPALYNAVPADLTAMSQRQYSRAIKRRMLTSAAT